MKQETLESANIWIAHLDRQLKTEREEHFREVKKLEEERNMLRYCIKGICADRLSIRVNITDSMITQSSLDLAQTLISHYSSMAAHEIEKRLGDRHELINAYDEARKYIFYLQNHAANRGVQFSPFEEKVFN